MATGGVMAIGRAGVGLGSLVLRMEIDGAEVVKVNLSRFGESISDFRDFWRDYFAPAFYRQLSSNFSGEGSFVGGWAPLSARYAAWKAQHYPGKTILRRTDRLFASLQFDGANAGPEGVFLAEREHLVLGTTVSYARYHQAGTSRMPLRRILFLGARAGSTFGRLLHQFVIDRADQMGLTVAAARARERSGLL